MRPRDQQQSEEGHVGGSQATRQDDHPSEEPLGCLGHRQDREVSHACILLRGMLWFSKIHDSVEMYHYSPDCFKSVAKESYESILQ